MSMLSLALPAEAALPLVQTFGAAALNLVRPLIGLSILAVFLMLFKPLLIGVLRAALLVVKPRQTLEERAARRLLQSVLMLQRAARDVEVTHPSLACELRAMAARN